MFISIRYLILIFISIKISIIFSKSCKPLDDFEDSQLIITRSAVVDSKLNRRINIYWYNKNFIKGDIVAIYKRNPKKSNASIIFKHTPNLHSGSVKTSLKISFFQNFLAESNRDFCLPYFAAWIRNGEPKKVTCLTTHRNWMWEMKNSIGPYHLSQIILPGSYKSGSYVKNLPSIESYIEKSTVTQNQDLYTQLVHGIRYLDIQLGYYPNDTVKYWSIEKCLKQTPLMRIISDLKLFLNSNKEIIVLTFRNSPEGFENDTDYDDLKNNLKKNFRGLLMYESINAWKMTLNEIWESNKRLIINFHDSFEPNNDISQLKPKYAEIEYDDPFEVIEGVLHAEFNIKYEFKSEYEPVSETDSSHLDFPRVVMAAVKSNYTPDCSTDAYGTNSVNYQTTRGSADIISPILLQIYNEEYFDTVNVIVVNFADAVGIVEFAKEWNRRRASPCYDYYRLLMTPSTIYYV